MPTKKEYYEKNKEKVLATNRKWKENNLEFSKKIAREYYHNDKKLHPEKYLWKQCYARALKRGLDFDLTIEDIVIPNACPIMGVPFIMNDKKYTPSVDRIDSAKGYTKDNIQIICTLANSMKWNSTKEELLSFCHGVLALEKEGQL